MKPREMFGWTWFAIYLVLCVSSCSALRGSAPLEREVRASDGARLCYDVRGAGEPTLVFVHCWAGSRSFWREQLDLFSRDHRVVALDLAGHGASQAHEHVSLEQLARDLIAVLDDAGVERCVLIGHSLGGPVSLRAAPMSSGRVRAVIGVETMHDVELDVPRARIEATLRAFEADFVGTMRAMVRAMLPERTPHELVEWITEQTCASDANAMLAITRALLGTDLPALLAGAGVPVRCINSAGRPPFIQDTSIEHNRAHGDYDAVLIEGTGHFPQLERPREFNARLREFLDDLSLPR